jgi:hypothetical protein
LALRLQPETRRIVVIGRTAEVDRHVISRAQQAARSFPAPVEFDFWTNRSMSEITQTVRSLPPGANGDNGEFLKTTLFPLLPPVRK